MTKDLIKLARHLDLIGEKTAANDLKRILLKNAAYRAASPQSIQDFNGFLAIILNQLQVPQTLVDMSQLTSEQLSQVDKEISNRGTIELLKSLTSVPNRWIRPTQAAWKEFVRLAGEPDAGTNPENRRQQAWPRYAKLNGFQPTLKGMFDFVAKHMGAVMPAAEVEAQDRSKRNLQSALSPAGEQQYADEQDANHNRMMRERDMAEHKRIYDAFVNENSPRRQREMLSTRESRAIITEAIKAVEGIDNDVEANSRLAVLGTSAQARLDEKLEALRSKSAKAVNALIKIADTLDRKGLADESTAVDSVIKYLAK